ncbi:MAG: hypothetical protein M1821_003070 [Bathelium mastoideum]|nr:MAG: hypothetical protein M1821_003070 [Bathelium mastoideum]
MADSPSLDNFNMTSPGPATELLGRVAFHLSEMQPFFPMYLHLILSALFPIFTGAHASLSRPSSAAKPPKRDKNKESTRQEDDGEEEEKQTRMEGLSPSDAIMFPLLAGATLSGLYFLIKWLQDAALLNKILNWYFSGFAVFSVGRLATDWLVLLRSFVFPKRYLDTGAIWKIDDAQQKAVVPGPYTKKGVRNSPLPGTFSRIPLPSIVCHSLWVVRAQLSRRLVARLYIRRMVSGKLLIGILGLLGSLIGITCVAYFNLIARPWFLTNVLGFAFAYSALQFMSPTTFATGSLILGALFFYDIYFVFYTPMMVTVAKELDVPIKLLFPRPTPEGAPPDQVSLSMLGLGDIVLPGIMMGLALRFDLYMHYLKKQSRAKVLSPSTDESDEVTENTEQDHKAEDTIDKTQWETVKAPYTSVSGQWGDRFWSLSWPDLLLPSFAKRSETRAQATEAVSFPKPYFYASIFGYVLGMCVTLAVMQIADHAQPALLYLVPGVLGSVWLTGLARGELKQMWMYDETAEDDEEKEKKKKKKRETENETEKNKSSRQSFFSAQTRQKQADSIGKSLAQYIGKDDSQATVSTEHEDDEDHEQGSSHGKAESSRPSSSKSSSQNLFSRDHPDELIFFSVALSPASNNRIENNRPSYPEGPKTLKTEQGRARNGITPSAPDGPRVQRRQVNGEPSGKRLRVS